MFTTVCHHHLYSHRTSGQRVGDALSSKASLDKPSPWTRPIKSKNIPLSLLMQGHLFILAKLHLLNFPFQCYRSVISYPGVWVQTKGFLPFVPLKNKGAWNTSQEDWSWNPTSRGLLTPLTQCDHHPSQVGFHSLVSSCRGLSTFCLPDQGKVHNKQ